MPSIIGLYSLAISFEGIAFVFIINFPKTFIQNVKEKNPVVFI